MKDDGFPGSRRRRPAAAGLVVASRLVAQQLVLLSRGAAAAGDSGAAVRTKQDSTSQPAKALRPAADESPALSDQDCLRSWPSSGTSSRFTSTGLSRHRCGGIVPSFSS